MGALKVNSKMELSLVDFLLNISPAIENITMTNNANPKSENVRMFPMMTATTLPKNLFIFQNISCYFADMSYNRVVLLLGTNLNNKEKNLNVAKSLIECEISSIHSTSEILETEPEGYQSQHSFLNQMIEIHTSCSPMELLHSVKAIENKMGRKYLTTDQVYQDRIIDIDILTFNEINFNSSRLIVPHPQIKTRKFINSFRNSLLKG